ncbi:MAG: hypothetical protein AB1716_18635 [Planctomycetota bacterium]
MASARLTMRVAAAAAFTAVLMGGCRDLGEVNPEPSTDLLAGSAANARVINAGGDRVAELLAAGNSAADVVLALLIELRADPRVLGAGADPEENIVWVDFEDGETQYFLILDDAAAEPTAAARRPVANEPAPSVYRKAQAQQPAVPATSGARYAQPASNYAFLGNALEFYHGAKGILHQFQPPFGDATPHLETMLKARNYVVVRPDPVTLTRANGEFITYPPQLTVDDFDDLTSYGVIVLEGHNGWRDPEYAPEAMFPSGTCGGPFSRQCLLTVTPGTQANILKYATDMFCGRVSLWNIYYKGAKYQFFGVTPNYVREHDARQFPKNTIFVLNGCRGEINGASAWRELVFEKCPEGATVLIWSAKVDYPRTAAPGVLRLFQLMTATNPDQELEMSMTVAPYETTTLLESYVPPQGGIYTDLELATYELYQGKYLIDKWSGAQLAPHRQNNHAYDPILMPHPIAAVRDDLTLPQFLLIGYAGGSPTVTVGGSAVTAGPDPDGGYSDWLLTNLVAGMYGDIVMTENGITGIARPLRRWRPSVKFAWTTTEGMQVTCNVTVLARATLQGWRTSIWNDPPPARFDALVDPDGTAVNYLISGTYNDGQGEIKWQGSGARTMDPSRGEAGRLMCATDGASLTFNLGVTLDCTMTVRNLSTGATTTSNVPVALSFLRQGVPVSADWTVAAQSFTSYEGGADVSWNAFGPEPAYDPNEPR